MIDLEKILEAARESHLDVYGLGKDRTKFISTLERFAAAIRSATKEEDARIADNIEMRHSKTGAAIRESK